MVRQVTTPPIGLLRIHIILPGMPRVGPCFSMEPLSAHGWNGRGCGYPRIGFSVQESGSGDSPGITPFGQGGLTPHKQGTGVREHL